MAILARWRNEGRQPSVDRRCSLRVLSVSMIAETGYILRAHAPRPVANPELYAAGSSSVNVLPTPGTLIAVKSPLMPRASSRLIDSPSPVPSFRVE